MRITLHQYRLYSQSLCLLMLSLQPRVLKRPQKNHTRVQIQTLNCRTLLDDERLDELNAALTKNGIDICALQETWRDRFFKTCSNNYSIFTFGECSSHTFACVIPYGGRGFTPVICRAQFLTTYSSQETTCVSSYDVLCQVTLLFQLIID